MSDRIMIQIHILRDNGEVVLYHGQAINLTLNRMGAHLDIRELGSGRLERVPSSSREIQFDITGYVIAQEHWSKELENRTISKMETTQPAEFNRYNFEDDK